MAKKKNKVTIDEYTVSPEENKVADITDNAIIDLTADLIKSYKEQHWDDNRIAARLMITVKQVKEVK